MEVALQRPSDCAEREQTFVAGRTESQTRCRRQPGPERPAVRCGGKIDATSLPMSGAERLVGVDDVILLRSLSQLEAEIGLWPVPKTGA
jgi:hypothetical protein